MESLKQTLSHRYGIEITDEQQELLCRDLNSIIDVNTRINLTRIQSFEDGLVLHLEDSLLGLPFVNEAPEGLYGDLGTGGGFPGIPICITTHRQTLLVDSVQKKVRALEPVIEELGLSSYIDVYGGRIEDLARERKGSFSVLTARALSSLGSLLELAAPLLCMGGYLVCYKAQPQEDELENATALCSMLGFKLIHDECFELSNGMQRRFFVYKKVTQAQIKLPRRVGMAQRNPLTIDDCKTKPKHKSHERCRYR